MVGVIALALGLWPHVGGWSTVAQAAEKAAPGWTALTGIGWTPLSLFSWYFVWFIAYFTRIEFVTKMYTARDARAARLGTAWGLILILLFINFMVYFGAAARALIWDKIKSPDQALPTLMATYLSPFWAAVALSGVAAAAMSTVSSLLLLSGAAISHDFLRKSYFEPRGIVKSEGYYLAISRLTLLAVGLVALAGAFKTPTLVLTIVSYAVALSGAAFAMPMLLGLIWRRTSPAAALASSVGGFLGSAFWAVATEMGYAWAKAMHPIIPGFVISLVLILAVSFFTSPSSKETLQRFFPA
jgi:sodium/proline symporter